MYFNITCHCVCVGVCLILYVVEQLLLHMKLVTWLSCFLGIIDGQCLPGKAVTHHLLCTTAFLLLQYEGILSYAKMRVDLVVKQYAQIAGMSNFM